MGGMLLKIGLTSTYPSLSQTTTRNAPRALFMHPVNTKSYEI